MGSPWKVILAFMGVFMAGAVFGGFFTLRTAGKRPANPPSHAREAKGAPISSPAVGLTMMRQLGQRLKLTEEQKDRIRPIIGRAEEDLQRLRKQNFQDTTRVMERMHSDVSAWLTPEQRDELETLKRNLQERLRRAQDREREKREAGGAAGPRGSQQTQATPERPAEVEARVGGAPKGN